jgi:hypothetical protein
MRANSQKSELQFTFDVVCCLLTWGIPYLDYILHLPISIFNGGLNHLNQIKMCLWDLIFYPVWAFQVQKNGINLLDCNILRSTDFQVCIEEEDTEFG